MQQKTYATKNMHLLPLGTGGLFPPGGGGALLPVGAGGLFPPGGGGGPACRKKKEMNTN